jgi:hypothetical protein
LLSLFCIAFIACAAAASDNGDSLDAILVPVAFRPNVEVQGAFGTRWRGEVWIHNGSAGEVDIQQVLHCPIDTCPAIYPAGYIGPIDLPLDDRPDGAVMLYPNNLDAKSLIISNRIFEISRRSQPQGIEIPIVHERDFLTGPATYLGIPSNSAVRAALRVYDPRLLPGTTQPGVTVRVEVLNDAGAVVATGTLQTVLETSARQGVARAGFVAIYDVANVFPIVKTLTRYHLRLTPTETGREYWAMVSVTDNDTQQVLTITAQ